MTEAAAAAADGAGSGRRQRRGRGVAAVVAADAVVAVMKMRVIMKRSAVVTHVSTVKWHVVDAVTVVAVVGVEMMRRK